MSGVSLLSSPVSDRIEEEMQLVLDRYLPHRSPLRVDDYRWDEVRPDAVDQEFIDALTFVTLVESNPTAAAENLLAAADRGNAPWLRQFVTQTWHPEESMHPVVFREYLVSSGAITALEVDRQIQDSNDRGLEYGKGYSDLQGATYGWLQELITWRFYEAMRDHVLSNGGPDKPTDMVLVKVLGDVAKQENFHRYIYLCGIRTILKHAPERKWEVVSTVGEFLMPGHHMTPEMQTQAPQWSEKVGFSHRKLGYDIVGEMIALTGYNGLAQASLRYAKTHDVFWYLKVPGVVLSPFSGPSWSPVNALVGRVLARMYA